MGEIDEKKPFESVQDALSLFGDNKNNHVKTRSSSSEDMEKEEIEVLRRELAKLKLKLEEKDSSYKQAILELDHTQSVVEDLSSILTGNELEKEISIYEGRQDKALIITLQARLDKMQDQLHVTEKEATKLRDENLATIKRAELSETIRNMERGETEELYKKVQQLNETIQHFKMMENEASKEKDEMCKEKDALKEKVGMVHDLETQLLEKSEFIHNIQKVLHLANERDLKKVVSNDSCQFDQCKEMKEELELQEKKNFDQASYISLLETELKQLKQLEIKAKETEQENEAIKEIEQLKKELENARTKMGELRNRGEQAISRAEAAEKAKATLEEQIQRRRDQRKRRKAALAALQEASTSREIHSFDHENNGCKIYQPLGEVLNMRF